MRLFGIVTLTKGRNKTIELKGEKKSITEEECKQVIEKNGDLRLDDKIRQIYKIFKTDYSNLSQCEEEREGSGIFEENSDN